MKVLVIGAGGVGAYFGARLAEAGAEVNFIARGKHLEAIQENGLKVLSPKGDIYLEDVKAFEDPAQVGKVDVILNCVKMYDLRSSTEAALSCIDENTLVVLVQNGVESAGVVSDLIKPSQLARGFVIVGSHIKEPGVIEHTSKNQGIYFENIGGHCHEFATICKKAGLDTDLSDDFETIQWGKFVRLSPMATACAVAKKTFGAVREDPQSDKLLRDLIEETLAVGRAKGVKVDKTVDDVLNRFPPLPYDFKPSMYVDVLRGKPIEAEYFCGAVSRLGKELGVETPVNTRCFESLKPYLTGSS